MGRKIHTGIAGRGSAASFPNVDVTTSIAVQSNKVYWCDTSAGPITLTLPSNPSQGDLVRIVDVKGNFDTNNLIVSPGASGKIMRQTTADTMTVSVAGAAFSLLYYNSADGWLLENI